MGDAMKQANSTAVVEITRGQELITELQNKVQYLKEIEEMLQAAAQRAAHEISQN